MPQPTPIAVVQPRERALLVGVAIDGRRDECDASLDELEALADTAGAIVIGRVVQRRHRIDPAYFIGRGKAEEIARLCHEKGVDVIIFDHDLSPAQVRNLEQLIEKRVMDRTELILDIFAKRARTKQAKLQVELAQLRYQLPRLRRMWTHLSRTEGALGARGGPGEQQLELDRRRAYRRIAELERQLKRINKRVELHIHGRRELFTVALVGYTNVGKSTLMNALTNADVYVEDRLFATLDATTRTLRLRHGQRVLLTDTVGFINHLPAHLIASFHATLAEVRAADLLLHVADVSHPRMELQVAAVQETLRQIGVADKPVIIVLNKADQLPEYVNRDALRRRWNDACLTSALTGEGLDELKERIEAEYRKQRQVEVRLKAPSDALEIINWVYAHGVILNDEIGDGVLFIHALMEKPHAARLQQLSANSPPGVELQVL